MRLGGVVVVAVAALAWAASGSAAAAKHPPRVWWGQSNSTSTNWAGYAAASGNTFSDVSASWTQPSADCTSTPSSYAAFWVGLDGATKKSHSVEQIGADADCVNGVATYYAWYEMYPKRPVTISGLTVASGEPISARVHSDGSGGFTLSISVNGGTPTVITATAHGAKTTSAEVIAEAPSYNPGPFGAAALTDFGTIDFTAATVDGGAIGDSSPDQIQMVQLNGAPKATTSDLSGLGEDFSVTWNHS